MTLTMNEENRQKLEMLLNAELLRVMPEGNNCVAFGVSVEGQPLFMQRLEVRKDDLGRMYFGNGAVLHTLQTGLLDRIEYCGPTGEVAYTDHFRPAVEFGEGDWVRIAQTIEVSLPFDAAPSNWVTMPIPVDETEEGSKMSEDDPWEGHESPNFWDD